MGNDNIIFLKEKKGKKKEKREHVAQSCMLMFWN